MICTIIDCAPAMATTPQSGAKLSETGMQLSVPDPSGSLMDALLNMQALLTEGMQHGHGEFWVGLSFFLVLFFGLFILQRLAGVQSELRSMQGMLSALGDSLAQVVANQQNWEVHGNLQSMTSMTNLELHASRTPTEHLLEDFVSSARSMAHLSDLLAYQDRQWHEMMQQLEDVFRAHTELNKAVNVLLGDVAQRMPKSTTAAAITAKIEQLDEKLDGMAAQIAKNLSWPMEAAAVRVRPLPWHLKCSCRPGTRAGRLWPGWSCSTRTWRSCTQWCRAW